MKGKNVLVLGGMGFIGSSIARRCEEEGADVIIVDNMDPNYGGNYNNIKGLSAPVYTKLSPYDIKHADYIFHCVAQVRYTDSLKDPLLDLDLTGTSTLRLLMSCVEQNPNVKIIFTSSRMVLGNRPNQTFTEKDVPTPTTMYGIHKFLSEQYLKLYYEEYGIKSIICRITNPYGPRQQVKNGKYSLVGYFIRKAMENDVLPIYGEGRQLRDYVYIDDVVDALYLLATSGTKHDTFNIGSGVGTPFIVMVQNILNIVESGSIIFKPTPKEYINSNAEQDSVADISKLKLFTNFSPKTSLEKGITLTHRYLEEYKREYF